MFKNCHIRVIDMLEKGYLGDYKFAEGIQIHSLFLVERRRAYFRSVS